MVDTTEIRGAPILSNALIAVIGAGHLPSILAAGTNFSADDMTLTLRIAVGPEQLELAATLLRRSWEDASDPAPNGVIPKDVIAAEKERRGIAAPAEPDKIALILSELKTIRAHMERQTAVMSWAAGLQRDPFSPSSLEESAARAEASSASLAGKSACPVGPASPVSPSGSADAFPEIPLSELPE